MDKSTELETEYLTDLGLQRSSTFKNLPFIGPYQPNTRCDDLALSCELYRLTHIYRSQLEETPVKLTLVAVLHFRRNPHSEVKIVYESSESIGANRICRDPLYAAYYVWFQQFLDFINTLVLSWGLWPTRSFSHRQAAVQGNCKFGSLLGKGKGMGLGGVSLAGCWDRIEGLHTQDSAVSFQTAFEDLITSLLDLNKDADLSQADTLEDQMYEKAYRLITTQQLTQIVPEVGITPRPATDIKRKAALYRLFLIQRPPTGLLQCCFSSGDMDLEVTLERVVQLYAEWERTVSL